MRYLHVCCGKPQSALLQYASPAGVEPMTDLGGGRIIENKCITARIPGFPQTSPQIPPTRCAEARRTQVADATLRDLLEQKRHPFHSASHAYSASAIQ